MTKAESSASGLVALCPPKRANGLKDCVLGSCLHAYKTLQDPRYEDYEFQRAPGYDHPMAWLGNGWTIEGLEPETHDAAFYLQNVDIPPGE